MRQGREMAIFLPKTTCHPERRSSRGLRGESKSRDLVPMLVANRAKAPAITQGPSTIFPPASREEKLLGMTGQS